MARSNVDVDFYLVNGEYDATKGNQEGMLYFASDGIYRGNGNVGGVANNHAVSYAKVQEMLKPLSAAQVLVGAVTPQTGANAGKVVFSSLNADVFTQAERTALTSGALWLYEIAHYVNIKTGFFFRSLTSGDIKVTSAIAKHVDAGDTVVFSRDISKSSSYSLVEGDTFIIQGNIDIYSGGAAGLVPSKSSTTASSTKYLSEQGTWVNLPTIDTGVMDVQVEGSSIVDPSTGVANIRLGEGLAKDATDPSIHVVGHTTQGIEVDDDYGVGVKADNSTIGFNTNGQVIVKSGGITATQLAANAVTTAKITDGNVTNAKVASTAALADGQLATASTTVKGGIKVGNALSVDSNAKLNVIAGQDGTIRVSQTGIDVSLNSSQFETTGPLTIKEGGITGIEIADEAVSSNHVASDAELSDGQLATASNTVKGAVKVQPITSGLTVDNDNLKLQLATGGGLSIVSGDTGGLSLSDATKTSLGKADSALQTSDIINNLTSTSTTDALSANQGKVLKGLVDTAQETAETALERLKWINED